MHDLAGKTFGRLTVTDQFESRKKRTNRIRYWLCQCTCGNQKWINGASLKTGDTRSCGCVVKEIVGSRSRNANQQFRAHLREKAVTHGMAYTKIYKAWQAMQQRCHNPNSTQYPNYGARGITVCKEWRKDFTSFYNLVGDPPSPKHSIDRKNNDGNYEPGNIRWATQSEQNKNRRRSRNG